MVLYDGAGTASGSATASLDGVVIFYQSGTADGSASMTGAGGTLYISTGWALGSSDAEWDYIQEGDGTASGDSSMTGDGVRVRTTRGAALGSSWLRMSVPMVIMGRAYLFANPVVDVAIRATPKGLKTFSWLQLLQRGDLALYICERTGGVVIPWLIVFNLFFVRPNGTRKAVGPQNRQPVLGTPGEFYATGLAGEAGQPGNWIIEWKIQKNPFFPVQTVEMPFRVLDGVLANNPRDLTPRKVKFGWN